MYIFSWRPVKTEVLETSSKSNYSQLSVHSFFGSSMEHLARRNSANYPVQSLYFNLQKQKAVIYTSERKK